MSELNLIKKLSELQPNTNEYSEVLSSLVKEHWDEQHKIDFLESMKLIGAKTISMNEYQLKHKDKEILMYDVENFMPIYKGVKKWEY